MIAGVFADALGRSTGSVLSAAASRSLDRAESFTAARPGTHAYGSYEELVSDPEIEVVYIATPQHRHKDDALLALSHGKNIVVEKPLALSADDVRTIAESAGGGQGSPIAIEGMWTLFNPLVRRLLEIVDAGELGALRGFSANTGPIGVPRDHRALSAELGASVLWECLVYPIAVLTAIDPRFQTPEMVNAVLLPRGGSVDVSTAVQLGSGDSFAQFAGSFSAGSTGAAASSLQILFENGWVELADVFSPSVLRIGWNDGRLDEHTVDAAAVGFGYQIDAVAAAVRGSTELDARVLLPHTLGNTILMERIAASR
jgi:predicted dehydrogenase